MSDDDEMIDSQQATQSNSQLETSLSLSSEINNTPDIFEPWGRIVIYKISRKRLGIRVVQYLKSQVRIFGKQANAVFENHEN